METYFAYFLLFMVSLMIIGSGFKINFHKHQKQ